MGHLGSRVSALLDGQLAPAEEERCWQHVHACHACRDLVEREGWVKARLSGLDAGGRSAGLSGPLARALRQPDVARRGATPRPRVDRRGSRSAVLALGGVGTGAAVLGVALLVLVPGGPGDPPPPASSLTGTGSAAGGAQTPQPVLPGHWFVPVRDGAR